jgi:preprotein translocase subunit SecA
MSILTKIFGDPNEKYVKTLQPLVKQINELEFDIQKLSDEDLKKKTEEFRKKLESGQTLDEILPEAFAVCREAAKRVMNQRHFDAQLLGGIVLHKGEIAEMKTGEGKTLTATLAVYLNALTGKGVHVVTVNDYLAQRDVAWMGQIYNFLGLTTACIIHDSAMMYDPEFKAGEETDENRDKTGSFKVAKEFLRPVARKEAYACDILYGTNNEFGFDYLRDNMSYGPEHSVQRELNYAIVDEIDSILIDEARTPLIISAPAEESTDKYYKFAELVRKLKENEDYNIDEKMRAVALTEAGIAKLEQMLGIENIYADGGGVSTVHHIEQSLKAQALFKLDKDYVVKDGEVVIVDEFTGRLMFGRRYSEGLHQAIEAKENVKIQRESMTLATVTFQNYFRLYKKLSGMTGTAATEAEEFGKIYKLDVVQIPTNKPLVRKDAPDRVFKNENGKFTAAVAEIKARHEKGQPVLVGTISIEKNERLSEMLAREGIPHKLLNAKNHEKEAEIIAQAGKLGAVTVATNMAGRGVDIILGGNPSSEEEAQKVRELGGLLVLGTERHESRRIDNQLRGRSGRQGDPGESIFFVSLGDDLMRIFGGDRAQNMMERLGIPEDMPVENSIVSKSIESAQRKVEGHHFDIRKHLLEYDDVLNKHREVIYKRRKEVLDGVNLKEKVLELVEKEIESVVLFHTANDNENEWNLEEIYEVANTIFPVPTDMRVKMEDIKAHAGNKLQDAESRTRIIEYLANLAKSNYEKLEQGIVAQIGEVDAMRKIEKGITLRAIDTLWVEHLEAMDHLRQGVGLRGYGQRDPLVEYKHESYKMFAELLSLIDKQVVYSIYKVALGVAPSASPMERNKMKLSAADKGGSAPAQIKTASEKIGRNDLCSCGSGKKFKKCCGK